MSTRASEVTPSDEITNIPLPVYVRRSNYLWNESDFHHAFHPRKDLDLGYIPKNTWEESDPELSDFLDYLELTGMSVRFSRGQDLPKNIHQRYHNTFRGPNLPTTTQEKFTATVLNLSGIVPRKAIYLPRRGDYEIKELTDKEHAFISDRKRLHYEHALSAHAAANKRAWFGKFFASYALEQSLLDIISESVITEFLDPKTSRERVSQLGKTMLISAADETTESLKPVFIEARKQRMMINPKIRARTIVRKYMGGNGYDAYHAPLTSALSGKIA